MKKAFITIITLIIVLSVFISCSNEANEPEMLADGSIVLNRTITTWKTGTYVLNRNVGFSDLIAANDVLQACLLDVSERFVVFD